MTPSSRIIDEPTHIIAVEEIDATERRKNQMPEETVDAVAVARDALKAALGGKSFDATIAAIEALIRAHIARTTVSEPDDAS